MPSSLINYILGEPTEQALRTALDYGTLQACRDCFVCKTKMASGRVGSSLLTELKSWARYILPSKYVAVYYPTPPRVARQMLQLAEAGPQDTVYDLGCGDGRIVVTAARDFGAKGVGIELDPKLAAAAELLVKQHNLQDRVRIHCGDAAAVDVSDATILALYLSDQGNQALLKAVAATLKPGTRVVSLYFPVKGWEQYLKRTDTSQSIDIHLYAAPEAVK